MTSAKQRAGNMAVGWGTMVPALGATGSHPILYGSGCRLQPLPMFPNLSHGRRDFLDVRWASQQDRVMQNHRSVVGPAGLSQAAHLPEAARRPADVQGVEAFIDRDALGPQSGHKA